MAICTPMGPGFLLFFQTCDDRAGGYFPDYPKFVPKTRKQEKAAVIINQIICSDSIESRSDLEIALRLQLRINEIEYQKVYLTWLKREFARKQCRKRRNKVISWLLLH